MSVYRAKSIISGYDVTGELVVDGLNYYIREDFGYGTSLVLVDQNTIEKVETGGNTNDEDRTR